MKQLEGKVALVTGGAPHLVVDSAGTPRGKPPLPTVDEKTRGQIPSGDARHVHQTA